MIAIDQARALYESNGKDFDAVFNHHLREGIVVCSSQWFLMLRAEEWDGEMIWFVECGIGDLKNLVNLVALHLLKKIAFCRVKKGKKRTKVYQTKRLLHLAQREIAIP